jgi:hypothetical protein
MSNQQTTFDGYQLPPGMMLVAAPQQQQQEQSFPRTIEPSQHKTSTVAHSNSFKNNRIAPPPSAHKIQPINNMLQNNCIKFKI